MSVLRPVILAASGSSRLQRAVTGFPVSAAVVRRFVAGETRAELEPVVRELLADGRMVSVDFLGENTTDHRIAEETVAEYLDLIDLLADVWRAVSAAPADARWVRPAEVSVKLSALGQALGPDGPGIAVENLRTICRRAAERGVWVTVDAEDHTTTTATLGTVHLLRSEFPWLAVAIQAYLYRSAEDCAAAAASGARIRLCKGAYREPAAVAHHRTADVDAAYRDCLATLMRGSGYPMVATHDPAMIERTALLARECDRARGDLEYQMLFGVRPDEQRRLVAQGRAVRVYVPYGRQWYGYLTRRLAERPANLMFFGRALLSRS
ncbi:proline dehydrogenase family protein [Nocardia stercoris]|uniref:proline dehydrogenase n=1 Tax=Nocardia stercoris TaxID=2483361 RepID=A0A3M2LC76_9NOCA|nr:proline dehydrogenase family protein [Nocardia stercoris]RMI35004.1 proline dehydrogenase [Nocardia stercoris]